MIAHRPEILSSVRSKTMKLAVVSVLIAIVIATAAASTAEAVA
jgi:hypothetical protein